MRSFLARSLPLALVAAVAGCATTGTGQPLAGRSLWKKPAAAAKDKAPKKDSAADEKLAQRVNPFRKTAAEATTEKPADTAPSSEKTPRASQTAAVKSQSETIDTTSIAKTTTEKTPAEKTPAEKARPLQGEFHPETMKLIDSELADASADERAFWYDQLKRVDPAVIPQILQARRLTADIAERKQQDASWTDSTSDGDSSDLARDARSIRQTVSRSTEQEAAPVRQIAGREYAASKTDSNSNQREYDALAESQPEKSAYAVQRVTNTESTQAATAPSSSLLPSLATPRNALNRFLPNSRSGTTTAATEATASSNSAVSLLRPTDLDPPGTWQQQLDPLISLMEAEVAQLKPGATEESQTQYIERHVYLRLLYLMAQHPERALTAIPGIDSADQEFWQQLLWSMTNYFDDEHLPAAKDRAGQAVAQLATATQRLRERSELEIHNLTFCREIAHFGNFVRFPRDEFHAGDPALLYAEIENFKSELTVEGEYRTLIRSTMEILSPAGEVRWQKEFQAEEDLCANYRRDYFHNYEFTIPSSLPLGPHTLKLTVFDELSGKMVSQSANFVVR